MNEEVSVDSVRSPEVTFFPVLENTLYAGIIKKKMCCSINLPLSAMVAERALFFPVVLYFL